MRLTYTIAYLSCDAVEHLYYLFLCGIAAVLGSLHDIGMQFHFLSEYAFIVSLSYGRFQIAEFRHKGDIIQAEVECYQVDGDEQISHLFDSLTLFLCQIHH